MWLTIPQLSRVSGISEKRIRRYIKSGMRFYQDLRHTFASILLSSGADITYVAKQMRHGNPGVTLKIYSRWIPTKSKSYVELMDEKHRKSATKPQQEEIESEAK